MNQAPHPKPIDTVIQDLRGLLSTATPGTWTKGRTTHHTVSERQGEKPYPIAEFHHANDAAFCDFAHNSIPRVLDALDAAHARIAELGSMLDGAHTRGQMMLDAKEDWRRLALQFDGHRMQALGHLKTLVQIDNGYEAAQAAEAFLAAPPLAGEAVLAQRIADLAAQAPAAPEIAAALDRMDGLLDPSRKLLAVGEASATAQGARADMALIRAALQAAPPAPAAVAVPDELVELAMLNRLIDMGAKAAHAHATSHSDDGHNGTAAFVQWQELRAEMAALIRATWGALAAAPAQAVAVPQGWQAVPVEPTDAMLKAGDIEMETYVADASPSGIFKSMLRVAPRPPAAPTQEHATQLAGQGQEAAPMVLPDPDAYLYVNGLHRGVSLQWRGGMDLSEGTERHSLFTEQTLRAAAPAQAQGQPDCGTCNDHGAVGNILTAEPCPDCTAQGDAPHPPAAPWKDHQTARLVNDLRDCALQYHGAGQLRERIAHIVAPLCDQLKAAPVAPAQAHKDARDAALGRVAMGFVDRAGDVHPGIDDAETICAEFHHAMSVELVQWLPPGMLSAARAAKGGAA